MWTLKTPRSLKSFGLRQRMSPSTSNGATRDSKLGRRERWCLKLHCHEAVYLNGIVFCGDYPIQATATPIVPPRVTRRDGHKVGFLQQALQWFQSLQARRSRKSSCHDSFLYITLRGRCSCSLSHIFASKASSPFFSYVNPGAFLEIDAMFVTTSIHWASPKPFLHLKLFGLGHHWLLYVLVCSFQNYLTNPANNQTILPSPRRLLLSAPFPTPLEFAADRQL